MPTTLKRTMVTHTPPVQQVLKVGKQMWPELSDSECLVKLAEKGAMTMQEEKELRKKEWIERVESAAGGFRGVYGPNYLEEIREGWPE